MSHPKMYRYSEAGKSSKPAGKVLIVRRVLYTHRREPRSATSCWSNTLLPSGILNKWVHIYSHRGGAVKSKSVKAENTRFSTHPSQAHTHSDNFCVFVWRNVYKPVAPKIKKIKNPEYGWKRASFQQGFKTKKKWTKNSCIEYKDDSSLLRHCVSRHTELSNRSAVLFTAAVGLTFTCLWVLATITKQKWN